MRSLVAELLRLLAERRELLAPGRVTAEDATKTHPNPGAAAVSGGSRRPLAVPAARLAADIHDRMQPGEGWHSPMTGRPARACRRVRFGPITEFVYYTNADEQDKQPKEAGDQLGPGGRLAPPVRGARYGWPQWAPAVSGGAWMGAPVACEAAAIATAPNQWTALVFLLFVVAVGCGVALAAGCWQRGGAKGRGSLPPHRRLSPG